MGKGEIVRDSESIGRMGEDYVPNTLHRQISKQNLFKVTHLGAKYELFDFMVNLLNSKGLPSGPFFLLQVKATEVKSFDDPIKTRFTHQEVAMAHLRKVPAYLLVVQICGNRMRGYFVAIDKDRTHGFETFPKKHVFKNDANLKKLYTEIREYFEGHYIDFKSNFLY